MVCCSILSSDASGLDFNVHFVIDARQRILITDHTNRGFRGPETVPDDMGGHGKRVLWARDYEAPTP